MDFEEIKDKLESFLKGNSESRINPEKFDRETADIANLINSLMEKEIQANRDKEFYYQVIQKGPVPMILLDNNLNILDINPSFTEFYGCSREKIMGINISDFYSEFKLEQIDGKSVKEILETKKRVSGKYRMTFGGENKIINLESIPLLNDMDAVTHINMAFIDVSIIENQKVWYESILDSIPFPVSVTDLNMNWTYMNPAVVEMANVDRKEALGTQCSRWNADICRTRNCGVESLRRGEKKTYFDQAGGNYMVDLAWIKNANGENVGHIEIIQDITDLKLLEKRAKTFVQNNPLGITILGPDKKRLDLNKEYQRIWRGNYEELMSKKLYNFNIETRGDDIYASFETKKEAVTDINVSWEDGTQSYFRLYQNPIINDKGEIDVNYYTYQDMTPEVTLSQYMDDEVENVAHDLKCIADGRLEELKLEVGEADEYTREVRKQFLEITSNVKLVNDTLHSLVTDIQKLVEAGNDGRLNFSVDSSRYEGAYVDLMEGTNDLLKSVAVPVNEAMDICNSYADADFTARFSDDIRVKGDFLRFKEALNNIGINVSDSLSVTSRVTGQVAVNSGEVAK